jgi:hypothetical protein
METFRRFAERRAPGLTLAALLAMGATACDGETVGEWIAGGPSPSGSTALGPLRCVEGAQPERLRYTVVDPPEGVVVKGVDAQMRVKVLGEGSEVRASVDESPEHGFSEPLADHPAIIDLLPGVEVVISKSPDMPGAYDLVATCVDR